MTIDKDFAKAIAQYKQDISDFAHEGKAVATTLGRNFVNFDGNVSIKSDYIRSDYNAFRTTPSVVDNRQQLLKVCQLAYDRVGIVKNVLDIMSDFGSKGIKLRHEIPAVERFYQKWFEKVEGKERSERFINILFRLGSVVVYKSYTSLNTNQKQNLKSKAEISKDIDLPEINTRKNHIPIKYTFMNPGNVEVLGEDIGVALGTKIYILKLHDSLNTITNNYLVANKNNRLNKEIYKLVYQGLPKDLQKALEEKENYFILNEDRVCVYNYKKDDWQSWGKPLTYSILDDLHVLEKLKLADISALDGAISNIRLWKIGKLGDTPQSTLFPSKAVLEKLRNILANNVGGGTMDLVWGPELSFEESSTSVHNFLGNDKYVPTINAIYDCLGVPSALRSGGQGSSDKEGVVSLKILIERINYARNLLIDFWKREIESVQKACGFSKPAVVEFDYAVFSDEASEKQLLINLADRDIISHETVREKFSISHDIEESKISREKKKRGNKIPEKASPFHNPQQDHEYKKILLTNGLVGKSELGLELNERDPADKLGVEYKMDQVKEKKMKKPNEGRPKNITETKKRNPKTGVQISKGYETMIWVNAAQKYIHDSCVKGLSKMFGKKNLRSLSNQEHEEFEKLKCNILFSIPPLTEMNEKTIRKAFEDYQDHDVLGKVKIVKGHIESALNKEMSLEDQRGLYSLLYLEHWNVEDNN